MFARRHDASVRLKPLHHQPIKVPVFTYKEYINPAVQVPKRRPQNRLSAIQSHRSRVFARREERFPTISKDFVPKLHRLRVSENTTKNVIPTITSHQQFIPAPKPAGKTTHTAALPTLHDNTVERSNGDRSQLSKADSSTRVLGSQIAGVSSKEIGTQHLRNEKMATGWAQVRAGQTIPNLRDSQEFAVTDKSPTREKGISPDRKLDAANTHRSDKSSQQGKQNKTTKKQADDTDSTESGEKSVSKKANNSSTKTSVQNTKSKMSSGYGSLSSTSHKGTTSPKRPIFKVGTKSEPTTYSEKAKEVEGVYSSTVTVEDKHRKVAFNVAAHKEHVLTEKEAESYRHIKSAYQDTTFMEKQRRKQKFFKKLQEIQIDTALNHNKQLIEKAQRREESQRKQQEQLNYIRQKFEDDRMRRLNNQYIAKNFLDYDKMDRTEYGLPEHYASKTDYNVRLKRAGGAKVTALAFVKKQIKLKKNYKKMFVGDKSASKPVKDPKMEGVDQITLEMHDAEGNPKKGKKIDVKSELSEASQMIKDVDMIDGSDNISISSEDFNTNAEDTATTATSSNVQNDQRSTSKSVVKVQLTPNSKSKSDSSVQSTGKSDKSQPSQYKKPTILSEKGSIGSNKSTKRTDSQPAALISKSSAPKQASTQKTKLPANSTKPPIAPRRETTDSTRAVKPTVLPGSVTSNKMSDDNMSIHSKISVITEESEPDVDFYEKLMAKYGIELSDDDDDL